MTKQVSRSTKGVEDQAEGSPDYSGYADVIAASRTGVLPAVRLTEDRRAPAAETGLLTPVVAESHENTDAQDARRTTSEQAPFPMGQPDLARSSTPSVLIIEDSTELAEIIEATLQRLDMITTHETHGIKAFHRYQETRPDVVLLDIGLPDMIGWKVLEGIREASGSAGMPKVVIITAYGDPANRLIGKLQNVFEYLVKPFTAEEVERVVLSALSSAG